MARHAITTKMLQGKINLINSLTGNAQDPWVTREDGKGCDANVGNYHLSGAYGGVCLCQHMNEGGGETDVFSCGHVTKRQLFDLMGAYIRGIGVGQGVVK
jgi:hypothetical protein